MVGRVGLLLVLFILCAQGSTIYFKNSAACNPDSCKFSDPTAWEGGVVPNATNSVVINSTSTDTKITSDGNTTVLDILIINATFWVSGGTFNSLNAFVAIGCGVVVKDAVLAVTNGGDFTNITLSSSNIDIMAGGQFFAGSATMGTFFLDTTSSITQSDNSAFSLLQDNTYMYGSVYTTPKSLFTCLSSNAIFGLQNSDWQCLVTFNNLIVDVNSPLINFQAGLSVATMLYLAFNSTVSISQSYSVGQRVTLEDSSSLAIIGVSQTNDLELMGVDGNGTIYVDTSYLNLFGSSGSKFNGVLTLAGPMNASLSNFAVSKLQFRDGYLNQPANVNIIAKNLKLASSEYIAVPGSVLIAAGNSFSLQGAFDFSGGLTSYGGIFEVIGNSNISFGQPILLTSSTPVVTNTTTTSSFYPSGTINAPSVILSGASSLYSRNNDSIFLEGNLNVTSGVLNLYNGTGLMVKGNLVLSYSYARINAVGLAPNTGRALIAVTQLSQIAGARVTYSLADASKPKKTTTYPFLMSMTILGQFEGDPLALAEGPQLSLVYSSNNISLQYSPDDANWPYYAIVLLVVGIIVVGLIVVLVLRIRRRRNTYEAL